MEEDDDLVRGHDHALRLPPELLPNLAHLAVNRRVPSCP